MEGVADINLAYYIIIGTETFKLINLVNEAENIL